MNCTQCGARLEKNQRFCTSCGAPVELPREERPDMDLSAYFDENGGQPPVSPRRPAPVSVPRPGTREIPPARPKRSDRGLNIALLICTVLAIGVVTFLLILLLGRRNSGDNSQQSQTVWPSVTPQSVVTAPPAASQIPVLIVTPTPLPSSAPITPAPWTPVPITPAPATPVPVVTASPTPVPTPVSEYLLPESNSRYLTEADLKNLTHEQLCFARNEIFARHGRIFKTPEIAAYFSARSWYKGTVTAENFNEQVLNQYEWANISFIRDYENKYYGGSYY